MHNPWSIRRENGAALVISLLVVAVLLIVGSGALTNSRIETQMASNDTKVKQSLLAAEYAIALGENTVEQAASTNDLANMLKGKIPGRPDGLYGMTKQPAWDSCTWDERDSMDVTSYFANPVTKLPANLPPLPPTFENPHDRPRLMIETKHRECDSLVLPCRTAETWYFNISAHGARAKWTTLGNGQPDDKPGRDYPTITYNDRYPGTRIVLQSIYAKRY